PTAWTTQRGLWALLLVGSVFAILPTTLLLGAAFPIGLRLWAAHDEWTTAHLGERVGIFYATDVFGAILGSVAGGFLLLPALGSQRSVIAIARMIAACGLLLLLALHRARRPFAVTAGVAGTLLFVTAAANAPDPLGTLFEQRFPGARLLWHEEGVQTTVTVQ